MNVIEYGSNLSEMVKNAVPCHLDEAPLVVQPVGWQSVWKN